MMRCIDENVPGGLLNIYLEQSPTPASLTPGTDPVYVAAHFALLFSF